MGRSNQTAWLDRGDGTCRHYDEATKLCTIYDARPLCCRVEDYYRAYLTETIAWHDFVQLNVRICEQFQSESSSYSV